jgi:hypothetical protein
LDCPKPAYKCFTNSGWRFGNLGVLNIETTPTKICLASRGFGRYATGQLKNHETESHPLPRARFEQVPIWKCLIG